MMNDTQNRALWATALTNLAQAITAGFVNPPTSLQLWTQYVDLPDLLNIADDSYHTPLKINVHAHNASVRVPTGEMLGLDITWTTMTNLPTEPDKRQPYLDAIEQHHVNCCPPTATSGDIVEIPLTVTTE